MAKILNPVLPGFHPDPSICKVGEDYYIANSTFEWFGGVQIHHSRDLVHWDLIGSALDRLSQLNMDGNPSSGGIWAPCLTWANDRFWLIYTDVKSWTGSRGKDGQVGFKDTHNYLVTSPSIEGPWSDPIYMNSSGFDPSLFHDDDGKKWFVNMQWDHRLHHNSFAGILLQEYDPKQEKLTGPITNIFKGSDRKLTEAPHLYKRNGWYYLMTAEGGTSYQHCVTLARSRNLQGPYELHPSHPLLTSLKDVKSFNLTREESGWKAASTLLTPGLQKAGHGSMAPWTDDEWILAYLCGRPLEGTPYCPLGRETGLQKMIWKDDWPWIEDGSTSWEVTFSDKNGSSEFTGSEKAVWEDSFEQKTWKKEWNTLRTPADSHYSLSERKGWLCLKGQESPSSLFRQTVFCRRVQHFHWRGETEIDFNPEDFQQMAGLTLRYDETTQLLLQVSRSETQRELSLMTFDLNEMDFPMENQEVPLPEGTKMELAVEMNQREVQFQYRLNSGEWIDYGPRFDAGKLSDDYVQPMGFTGMFTGLFCHDLSGRKKSSFFRYFKYIEL